MNITLEEKLLLRAVQHPQYIMNTPNNKTAQAYSLLADKGYILKRQINKHTALYEFSIKRSGIHRLNKLQAQDRKVISFTELHREGFKNLVLDVFCWILIGLSIATVLGTYLYNFPNLADCSGMIGFYAIIMLGCVIDMPSEP